MKSELLVILAACSIITAIKEDVSFLDFELKFNRTCYNVNATGATPPEPLSIALENATCTTHTVQTVMESAADANPAYRFTVSYTDKDTGYTIERLSSLEGAEDCDWYLFYRGPSESSLSYQQNANISFFEVAPNSTVLLSYEPEPTVPPSPSPSPTPTDSPNNSGLSISFGFGNLFLALLASIMAAIYN